MRLAIVCYPTYGGSGTLATELALQLARRGHEVHLVSYAPPYRLHGFCPQLYFHEVEVAPYPLFEYPPYDLALAVTLHELALRRGVELIHAHYAIPHATSAWIARQMLVWERPGARLRVVTTLHGTDITLVGQERSYWAVTRFSIAQSDAVTAVSAFLRQETERAFGLDGDRIDVVPNFVDTTRFDRRRWPCRRDAFVGPEEKLVLHVSNFRPVKRVVDVVRVFARVARDVPSRLVLVGDGPDRPAAEAEADALDVADRVVFLGKQDTVEELLACADVFLLPSESESFGLGALEAMASGTPVVATRVGGLPEVVVDGETGFLRPVGDLEGLAQAVRRLLTDGALWARMSAAARARAEAGFAADVVVPRYEAIYQRVVG